MEEPTNIGIRDLQPKPSPDSIISQTKEAIEAQEVFQPAEAVELSINLLSGIMGKHVAAANSLDTELMVNPLNEMAKAKLAEEEGIIMQVDLVLASIKANPDDIKETLKGPNEKKYIVDRSTRALKAFYERQAWQDKENKSVVLPELRGYARHMERLARAMPEKIPPVALPPYLRTFRK